MLSREKMAKFDAYAILMMASLGLITTPISLYASISALLVEVGYTLFTHQDTNIHTLFWRIKLDLITLLRMYITFPLTMIGGIIDPFKVQHLFLSPLYKGDKKVTVDAMNLLFKKIEGLNTGKSTLVPLYTYTSDPNENQTHALYVVITKQPVNYRLSIINRGRASDCHRINDNDQNHMDGDVSYDNVPIKKIENYLNNLFDLKEFQNADAAYKTVLGEQLQEIGAFRLMIYGLPALWTFERESAIKQYKSKHARSRQKIGNCGISNFFGAISFHSSMQAADMRNKTSYKKFIYCHKKKIYENYSYLLDFDLQTKDNIELPSTKAKKQLNKMKRKLLNIEGY
jgi:hypothetical protein